MVGFRIDFGDRAVEFVKELDEKEKGDDDFNWVAEKWSGTERKLNKNFILARLNLIKYPWVDYVGLKKKSGVEREKHFVTANL